ATRVAPRASLAPREPGGLSEAVDDDGIRRARRIDALFDAALERPPAERAAFLEQACAGDAGLLAAVRRLLEHAAADDDSIATGGALAGALAELADPAARGRVAMPERIGPYRIVRELGRGGMAVVYLGERDNADFRQRVAVKVIQSGLGGAAVLQRFSRERAILASLNHPAIAKLFDGGTTADGQPYFAMELVEGEPIDRYCERTKLSIAGRLRLFLVVADAVKYAHRNLVVHRDIKPSNILVADDGQV